MKKSAPIYRYQLRVLAGKLENGSLSEVEKAGLAKMIRDLGDGLTVNEIFNIQSVPHRPQGMELEQRIFDVAVLQLPEKHGGGGLTKVKAIEEVAKIYNKTVTTIHDDYKSERGKKIRALVESNYYNPLEAES
jgi:hypothetical protein